MSKTRTLVLVKRSDRYSPINTGMFIEYTFFDVDTGDLLVTNIDSNYRNFNNWYTIVNNPEPWGIYSNLVVTNKRTKKGLKIVSADSYPQLEELATIDQIIELIKIATEMDN